MIWDTPRVYYNAITDQLELVRNTNPIDWYEIPLPESLERFWVEDGRIHHYVRVSKYPESKNDYIYLGEL